MKVNVWRVVSIFWFFLATCPASARWVWVVCSDKQANLSTNPALLDDGQQMARLYPQQTILWTAPAPTNTNLRVQKLDASNMLITNTEVMDVARRYFSPDSFPTSECSQNGRP